MHIDPVTARILDANFNRAREALRVMEEFVRFGLDDASLAARIKHARHELAALFAEHPLCEAHLARDILGDVGTSIAAGDEYRRARPVEVAIAAAKRVSEALRAIEEYAKIADADVARRVEQFRYRAYEIERGIAVRLRAGQRFADARLMVIVTEALCTHHWPETTRAVIDGGADIIQLREKSLDDRELLGRARLLVALCRDRGVMCVINDQPDIAVLCGADGVHVGQDDLPVAAARRIVGGHGIVGVSTHNAEQFDAAQADSPDYIAVGPVYPSPTKPQPHIAGLDAVRQAATATSLPIVAIGGITAESAAEVIDAGVDCICVCSAAISASNPSAATGAIRAAIDDATRSTRVPDKAVHGN